MNTTHIISYLTRFKRYHSQFSCAMILNFDGPRLLVVIVLVCNMNNRGNDMRLNLQYIGLSFNDGDNYNMLNLTKSVCIAREDPFR